MLKKKLGTEVIERDWEYDGVINYFKIPSTLVIPKSVWKIGKRAFDNCEKLREVKIPKSVWRIEAYAFYNCRNATIIHKKLRSFKIISQTAFLRCKDVKEETGN